MGLKARERTLLYFTDYNLLQRTHNLTLPMVVNVVMNHNFVYRMVFKDIY